MDAFVQLKLTEWQLPELIDTFADEAIDQESFLLLDEATIATLVPRIGLRLKFLKKFREFVVRVSQRGLHSTCSSNHSCLYNPYPFLSTTIHMLILNCKSLLGGIWTA
ncbi:unnamed protein product [Merluccius merluccius]